MTKKKTMQEEVEKTEVGEQMDLIDVSPKSAKPIIAAAKIYKKLMLARKEALAKEIEQKAKVLRLVNAAEIQPLEGGIIKFNYDGFTIKITPRDELVQVTEESE